MRCLLPLAGVVLLIAICATASATVVDIGGDPVYVQQDLFQADEWAVEVTSFVFDNSSASLPLGVPELNVGDTLFAYFLDMDNTVATSVNNFNVGDPDLYPVSSVGYLGPLWIVPIVDGSPTTDGFEDPYLFGFSGPAQTVVYTYYGDFQDPYCTLDPSEYSLVYYVAQSGWSLVPGTVSGGGVSDNKMIPGPGLIPEPSLVAAGLIGLGLLLKLRRR